MSIWTTIEATRPSKGRVESRRQASRYVRKRILKFVDAVGQLNGHAEFPDRSAQAQYRSDKPENRNRPVESVDQAVAG